MVVVRPDDEEVGTVRTLAQGPCRVAFEHHPRRVDAGVAVPGLGHRGGQAVGRVPGGLGVVDRVGDELALVLRSPPDEHGLDSPATQAPFGERPPVGVERLLRSVYTDHDATCHRAASAHRGCAVASSPARAEGPWSSRGQKVPWWSERPGARGTLWR